MRKPPLVPLPTRPPSRPPAHIQRPETAPVDLACPPVCAPVAALEGVAIGAVTLPLPIDLLLRAATTTSVAVGGLSVYALTTRRDFTTFGGLLVSALFALVALGVMQALFGGSWLRSAHVGFSTLVFCAYLVINTQMMMGGDKKRQIRPDEHILAALNLYTDIINIFMNILASMARDRD